MIEIYYDFDRYNTDTDGDGVTDYVEFCITCTDVLIPDGDIDTDGDGLTNAEEGLYGTNPDDLDSDNDSIGDYDEIVINGTNPCVKNNANFPNSDNANIQQGSFSNQSPTAQPLVFQPPTEDIFDPGDGWSSTIYSGNLYTEYGGITYSSNVSYTLNFNHFFDDNTIYEPVLAIASSLLSSITYDDNYLNITSGGTLTTNAADAVEDWMNFHGMTAYTRYDLSEYTDQHVSEMFIAHKEHTYNGDTKNIIAVAIRGTNGTLEEWQSNFDVGSTADYTSISGWNDSSNHMGFDITARRLNTKLNAYISEHELTGQDNVFWITGHSRGGALANILSAIRVNIGDEVFAYTFASPATTTKITAQISASYSCIFNIVNEDDLVPQLPLNNWGFVRYGTDITGSIEDDYASQWDALVSGDDHYTSRKTAVISTINTLANIAESRNECYTYRSDVDGYLMGSASDYNYVDTMCRSMTSTYPLCVYGYWYSTINYRPATIDYEYRIYQQPAFLMQLMAYAMSGTDVDGVNFALISVADYLAASKSQIINVRNLIQHPHYPVSYYLLASKIT